MPEGQNKTNPDLMTVFCNFFRAATRPIVTVIFAAVIAQIVIDRIDAPQWFLALAIPCITWWFAERTLTHIKEKKEKD